MINPSIQKFIKDEVKRQTRIILSGVSSNAQDQTEDVQSLYPGMPTILARPIMQPYGLSSKTPDGKLQVVGRQGDDPGNRIVLGHRDATKPSVNQGECKIYNEFGEVIYLSQNGTTIISQNIVAESSGDIELTATGDLIAQAQNGLFQMQQILLGSQGADNPFVLGDLLMTVLGNILDLIAVHTHPENGSNTGPPDNASAYTTLKTTEIDSGNLISDKIFGEKG